MSISPPSNNLFEMLHMGFIDASTWIYPCFHKDLSMLPDEYEGLMVAGDNVTLVPLPDNSTSPCPWWWWWWYLWWWWWGWCLSSFNLLNYIISGMVISRRCYVRFIAYMTSYIWKGTNSIYSSQMILLVVTSGWGRRPIIGGVSPLRDSGISWVYVTAPYHSKSLLLYRTISGVCCHTVAGIPIPYYQYLLCQALLPLYSARAL